MGTPAYMSPEQAAGRTKFVGPAADVYALGVILYECLTGRVPFTGDDAIAVIRQVVDADPPSLRSVAAGVPRDLELVCLKCLEKDPARRYPTVAAFADDLTRWAAGDTVSVRPPTVREKATRFVRRNTVVVGAGVAVLLALVVGSAVSISYGMKAGREAKRANDEAARAEEHAAQAQTNEFAALRSAADALAAGRLLAAKNDELEGVVARSLLGPIGVGNPEDPLTVYEANAFAAIARHRGTPLAGRFLREAIATPATMQQFRARAAYVVHAAVGLDPAARDALADALLNVWIDPPTDTARMDAARILARLGGLSSAAVELVGESLSEGLRNSSGTERTAIDSDFAAFIRGGRTAGQAFGKKVAEQLAEIICKQIRIDSRMDDTNSLTSIASQLDPPARVEACNRVTGMYLKLLAAEDTKFADWYTLSAAMVKFATLLEQGDRMALHDAIIRRIVVEMVRGTEDMQRLVLAFNSVAPRATPAVRIKAAGEMADMLITALDAIKTKRQATLDLMYLLETIVNSCDATTRNHILVVLTNRLSDGDRDNVDCRLRIMSTGEELFAGATPALVADFAAASLGNFTSPKTSADDIESSADSLSRLAIKSIGTAPGAVAPSCTVAAVAIISRLDITTNSQDRARLFNALVRLAPYLDSAGAEFLFASGTRYAAGKSFDFRPDDVVGILRETRKAATPEAVRVAGQVLREYLLRLFAAGTNPTTTRLLTDAVCNSEQLMNSVDMLAMARLAAARIQDINTKETDPMWIVSIANTIYGLGELLPPGEAQILYTTAVDALARTLPNSKSVDIIHDGVYLLKFLATQVLPQSAAKARTVATAAIASAIALNDEANTLRRVKIVWIFPDATTDLLREVAAVELLRVQGQVKIDSGGFSYSNQTQGDLFALVVGKEVPYADNAIRDNAATTATTVAAFAGPGGVPAGLLRFDPTYFLTPRPLPPQAIVDLLKHPQCVGAARDEVLNALTFVYGRPFRDVWAFVEFVKEKNLPLDLTGPPKLTW